MSALPAAVAVASCGRPDALARCLDAVLAGEAGPAELLVVDQGAPAGGVDVVSTRPPARLVRQEQRGLSASRNLAVAETDSPIVAFTDDDCVPDPGWLAALAAAFADERVAAVSGRMLPLGPPERGRFAVATRDSTERVIFSGRPAPWRAGTGGNLAVRRDWLMTVGGFDERLGAGSRGYAGEDIDLLDRLLGAGGRVLFEPRAVVRHERQPLERRRATRRTYGHGVGAACALALRRGDLYGAFHLMRWLVLRARLLAAAAAERRGSGVAEELLVLAGTARGLWYGLRVR